MANIPLGTAGLIIDCMVKVDWQLRQADYGWLALAAGVVAYELLAEDGELLSHGAARYKAAHPVLTTAVVLTTAGHLLEYLPRRYDPFAALFRLLRPAPPNQRRHPYQ